MSDLGIKPKIREKFADRVAENQADSTASDVAGVVADFNTLLASLKAAGLMTAD